MVRIAGLTVLEAAPALAAGAVAATAIDHGFLAGRPGIGLAWLGLLAVLHLVRATAERAVFPHLAAVVEPLRDHLVRRLVSATLLRATDRYGRPEGVDAATVTRLTRQVESVRSLVAALLRTARPLAVSVLAAAAGLAALRLSLLVFLAPLVLVLAVFPLSLRVLSRRRRMVVLADERITARIGESLLAARDVAALDAAGQCLAAIDEAGREVRRTTMAAARTAGFRIAMVTVGGYVPLFALLVAGPQLVAGGRISTGELVGAALYLTGYLLPAVQAVTGTVSAYVTQLGTALTRLAEASGTVPARTAETAAGHSAMPATGGIAVTVDRLTFAYSATAEPVLAGLSLEIAAGEHLAVVGASGIGKSTLANLLAGLERPRTGRVRLDGVPVDELDDRRRSRWVALVPQEAYVFAGTVLANLCYLNPDAEPPAIDETIRLLGASRLVERLGGLAGEITDPATQLSSGERQLLVLVRVHLSPARLVILDEAGCYLDPASEAVAEAAFAARPGTLIVIAHRLASAARADRVLMVQADGARLGPHRQLLAESGAYAELMERWRGGTGV
ncbi:ABC transporter ATP-binding protein [Actinoplanes philippinensis]|nr:ABC transporter ATP-binding protein [Actinoplanes philippinensis]